MNKINVLLVDDHPFIIEGYKNALNLYHPEEFEFKITIANDCKTAYECITAYNSPIFDIAFLDFSMPVYEEKQIFSGTDLASLLHQKSKHTKVVLLTMYTELLKINSIIQDLQLSGLVIKNDLTFDELLKALDVLFQEKIYYSESVVKLIENSKNQTIELDNLDRQILFHLSKGISLEDLNNYVPISSLAIERRRNHLIKVFNIDSNSDSDLVKTAKSKGFI